MAKVQYTGGKTATVANCNSGGPNRRVSIQIQGEPANQFRNKPLVWLCFGAGPISGGIHTTLPDAKRLRAMLDAAITLAERKDVQEE